MLKPFGRQKLLACLATAAILAPATLVAAQSDRELRDENQRLKTEVKQLQRELDAAKDKIKALDGQIESLRVMLADSRRSTQRTQPTPLEEENVSIDESVPTASPRAVLRSLQASYTQQLGDLEQGESNSDQRTIYLRTLDRWAASANREYRTKVSWHVRVVSAQTTRRGYQVNVQAVDPKTDAKLGDPFVVALNRNIARRYEQMQQRQPDDVVVLTGMLRVQVRVNRQRSEVGAFDSPRFIGRYAELLLTIDATSLLPPTEEEPDGDS